MSTELAARPAESTGSRTPAGARRYRPSFDVFETGAELILLADLPGTTSEDIEIQFEKGLLSVRAPVAARQSPETRYLLREYGVGEFFHAFRVGEDIDAERISAEYKQGVLALHLPKIERAKARRIEIR